MAVFRFHAGKICFNKYHKPMDIKGLIKSVFLLRQEETNNVWMMLLDAILHGLVYAATAVAGIAIATLLAFGYVPISGGGVNNPIGTISYVWGQGVLWLTIPIGVLFLIINLPSIIRKKQAKMLISLAGLALAIAAINLLFARLDLVTMMTPWFEFL